MSSTHAGGLRMSHEILQSAPSEVCSILRAFGRDPEGCACGLLTTEMGLAKYIVTLCSGEKLFLGSLIVSTRSSQHFQRSMEAAQSAAGLLKGFQEISLAGYLKAEDGGLLVDGQEGRRWMAVPFFAEKPACSGDKFTARQTCAYRLPQILGQLHAALREVSHEGLKRYPFSEILQQAKRDLAEVQSQEELLPADLQQVLKQMHKVLNSLPEAVAQQLDELPLQVIHSDMQPKNLMLGADGKIRVCDTEAMTAGPRIADLLFVFCGSDEVELAGKWQTVVDRLEEYLAESWPLSDLEVALLPSYLLLTSVSLVTWAVQKMQSPGRYPTATLQELTTSYSTAAQAFQNAGPIAQACKLAQIFAGHCEGDLASHVDFYERFWTSIDDPLPELPQLSSGKAGAAIFYNGTFSPPHVGHLSTAEVAARCMLTSGFQEAVVVFSPCHDEHEKGKLGHNALGINHRAAMLRYSGCLVDMYESSRVAKDVCLEAVHAAFMHRLPQGYQPCYLVGADVANWRWLRRKLAVGANVIIVVNRSGSEAKVSECEANARRRDWPGRLFVARGEDLGRSSSSIRASAAAGSDLGDEIGIPAVARYIREHGLYGTRALAT